jgi:hypothetical protein
MPSGFYGSALYNGGNVPNGTLVSAWINGTKYSETTTFLTTINSQQVSVYTMAVPGDDPSTPAVEGGNEGDTIVFQVGTYTTEESGIWHEGTDIELNLHVEHHDPEIVSVTPLNGWGEPLVPITFSVTYYDPDGWANLSNCFLLINTGLSPAASLYVLYSQNGNWMYLRNDANSAQVAGRPVGTDVRLSNTYWTLDVGQSSVTHTDYTLTVNFVVIPKHTFSGPLRKVYVAAQDDDGNSVGWEQPGTWAVNVAPKTGGFSPIAGSGEAGTPVIFYSHHVDADGYANIKKAHVLFNAAPQTAEGFWAYYDKTTHKAWLRNDDDTGWQGSCTVGAAETVSNSRGTINCGSMTATGTGLILTVKWNITFNAGFAGYKRSYVSVEDIHGGADGWNQVGAWTVTAGGAAMFQEPDEAKLAAPDGFAFIPEPLPAVERESNLSSLGNEGWTAESLSPIDLVKSLEKEREEVGASRIRPLGQDPDLRNALDVETRAGRDLDALLFPHGNWPVFGDMQPQDVTVAASPSVGTVSPINGVGYPNQPMTFTVTYSDPDGWQNLGNCFLLVNSYITQGTGLYLLYSQNGDLMYLRNDSGSAFITGLKPGTPGARLSNTYWTLDVEHSSVSHTATELTVNFVVIPKYSFSGPQRNVYMSVQDDNGNVDGWHTMGTWTVSARPSTGGNSPVAGSATVGTALNFWANYVDFDGYADVKEAHFLMNTTASEAGGFWAYYDKSTNLVWLRNDDNTGWVGSCAVGAAGTLSNSRGTVNCGAMTVTGTGRVLTVKWNVSLTSAMVGYKRTYLKVFDRAGSSDGWSQVGAWTTN